MCPSTLVRYTHHSLRVSTRQNTLGVYTERALYKYIGRVEVEMARIELASEKTPIKKFSLE
ncbi:hypothetical protein CANDROIZ_10029 [Candidatus Roizmanbacteria bacterium]|nr:hypothetical protein CANDROIZ_10029 [Candidatus Roizmanbacteria bacterium]